MHLFFLCPFAKAAWYSSPWFIKTELLFNDYHLMPDMINFLLSSNHPCISVKTLYTFLWCLWKSRSDFLFKKIQMHPERIFPMSSALLQDCTLYTQQLSPQMQPEQAQDQRQHRPQQGCNAPQEAGHLLFSDAAWSPPPASVPPTSWSWCFCSAAGSSRGKHLHICSIAAGVVAN